MPTADSTHTPLRIDDTPWTHVALRRVPSGKTGVAIGDRREASIAIANAGSGLIEHSTVVTAVLNAFAVVMTHVADAGTTGNVHFPRCITLAIRFVDRNVTTADTTAMVGTDIQSSTRTRQTLGTTIIQRTTRTIGC